MAKKSSNPIRDKYAKMTPAQIFAVWEQAATDGLRKGLKFHKSIFSKSGEIRRRNLASIRRMMATRPFTAADYRNTRRVARDIGRICNMVVVDTQGHVQTVVSKNVFDRAVRLTKVHTACPPGPVGAGGWCDNP